MKNKISTSLGLIIILIISITIALFVWKYSKLNIIPAQLETRKISQKKDSWQDKKTWKKYVNNEFYFSFDYPGKYSDKDFSNDDVERAYLTVPTSLIETRYGHISISVAPAVDVQGNKIIDIKDFLNLYPLIRRKGVTSTIENKIGDVLTIEDTWTADGGKGQQILSGKVVYALYYGIIYEINLIDDPQHEASEIFSSFVFTNSEKIAPVSPLSSKKTIYKNTFHKFQITIPAGWHLPPTMEEGSQIDFKTENNCYIYGGWQRICEGFSIQFHDDSGYQEGPKEAFARMEKAELDPVIINNFINGAITISSKPEMPFMGNKSFRVYHNFFEKEKRYITSGSINNQFGSIIKTFKLLQ